MMSDTVYKRIKVGGLLALIPLVLAAGPITGYIAGDWLAARLGLPSYVTAVFVVLGFAAAAREIVRIINAALRAADAKDAE